MRLLLDSDAIIALAKIDDTNHKKIVNFFKKQKNPQIFISHLCIAEVCTVLSLKISQDSAVAFLKNLRERNFIEIGYSIALRQITDKIFMSQKAKGISWVDCFNVAIMQEEKLDGLVSLNKFYKKFQFKTYP